MPTDDFQDILGRIVRGEHLTRDQARVAILYVYSGQAAESDIKTLLVNLAYDRATVDELAGAATAMREMAIAIPTGGQPVLDTCGTGGDIRRTFNISTAAALIAAGCGVKVVKHGNRSASSKAGSADVLEKLGVRLEQSPGKLAQCLEKANICFAFARSHHPAMKYVAEVRRSLGNPTIFNLLGPLTNPGQARLQLLGVFAPHMTERLASVLRELGSRRAWVVHAEDGLDEISTLSPTQISELNEGQIHTWTLDPRDLGIARATLADIQIADVDEAAASLLHVLDGKAGPKRDIAILNAAAALVIANAADDLAAGVQIARESLNSGAARKTLTTLIELTSDQ